MDDDKTNDLTLDLALSRLRIADLLEALDRRDQRIRELESRMVRKFASKQKEVARG
jgi:hypothetical protein